MARICSIHQPSFWPYLGLFDKIARSDVFVFLDDVQFVKNEFKNRNRFFLNSTHSPRRAEVGWLTLPVRHESIRQTIRETRVTEVRQTIRKHLATLNQAYGRSPAFSEVWPAVERLYRQYEQDGLSLADINEGMTRLAIELLDIKTELVGPSSQITAKSSDPTQRLIDICKHVGADLYLAGAGGRSYMQVEEFERQGIRLVWQDWKPFPYDQKHSPGEFVPHLSCLDLLLNSGARARTHFARQFESNSPCAT
jgi:WbqC-like protein family